MSQDFSKESKLKAVYCTSFYECLGNKYGLSVKFCVLLLSELGTLVLGNKNLWSLGLVCFTEVYGQIPQDKFLN